MPNILIYHFGPEQLTRDRLVRIIDDYFELKEGVENAEEWIQKAESRFEEEREEYARVFQVTGKTLFERVVNYSKPHEVKEHPSLRIYFEYDRNKDFNGLIVKGHGGSSEILLELMEFKPKMDAYLRILGIKYEDRTKLILK